MRPYERFFQLFFRDLEPGAFPLRFTVEATNLCNLGCTVCPREHSGRGYGFIDFALFEDLARQAANREEVLFYPQGFGESFLHPRYTEMLALLRRVGVGLPILISNGTLLDEATARQVLAAPPEVLILSLDGADKQVFEDIRRRADYDRIVDNVRTFFRLRDELGSTLPHIILSVVGAEAVQPSLERFRALWEPLLRDEDEIYVCTPVSWAGTHRTEHLPPPKPPAPGPRPPCRMLYKNLTVYYDGRATPCCYDHACRLEVGNAREESIESIWSGERLARLRRLHEQGRVDEIDLCRHCPDAVP